MFIAAIMCYFGNEITQTIVPRSRPNSTLQDAYVTMARKHGIEDVTDVEEIKQFFFDMDQLINIIEV